MLLWFDSEALSTSMCGWRHLEYARRSKSENGRWLSHLPFLIADTIENHFSFHERYERLAFLDDIGGELRSVIAADVFHRVDHSGRDEQDIAGFDR